MLKSFLVTVDGSEYSAGAVDCAANLSAGRGGRITLLYVIDIIALEGPFLADLSGSIGVSPFLDFQKQVRAAMEDKAAVVLGTHEERLKEQGLQCDTRIQTGIVSRVICQEAMEHDAVVIGRGGEHANWRGFLLGSVVEDVVRGCAKPVIVTPRESGPFCRILAAYDGSRTANRALGLAVTLAEGLSLPLSVVTVSSDSRAGQDLLDEASSFLEPHGVKVDPVLESGQPVEGILTATDRENCDLIVMGAYGHSRVRELLLGSTTDGIIRKAKVPVLLYR